MQLIQPRLNPGIKKISWDQGSRFAAILGSGNVEMWDQVGENIPRYDPGTLNLKTCMQRLWETLFKCFFIQNEKQKKANLGQLRFVPLDLFWGLVLH